jgi:hypothetical protein
MIFDPTSHRALQNKLDAYEKLKAFLDQNRLTRPDEDKAEKIILSKEDCFHALEALLERDLEVKSLRDKLLEYHDWFNKLDKFRPKNFNIRLR